MKNVLATTIISLAIVGLLVFYGATQMNKQAQILPQTTVGPTKAEKQAAKAKGYTLQQVAEHNTPQDCWLAIEGKVYDVTEFAASGNHPGGEAILNGCGKDATQMFNNRPNGTAHSDKARTFLPNFQIGNLVE